MSQLKAVVLFVMAAVLGLSLAVPRAALAADPSPEGRWVTIDDDTKQAKSVVEIFRKVVPPFPYQIQFLTVTANAV